MHQLDWTWLRVNWTVYLRPTLPSILCLLYCNSAFCIIIHRNLISTLLKVYFDIADYNTLNSLVESTSPQVHFFKSFTRLTGLRCINTFFINFIKKYGFFALSCVGILIILARFFAHLLALFRAICPIFGPL